MSEGISNITRALAPADVCLVSMPYGNPEIPSLALGLLQAVLLKAGIKTRSIYGNLLFAEQIGMKQYDRSHSGDPRIPLAEWSFASSAFPDFHPNEDEFVSQVYAYSGGAKEQSIEEFAADLRFVRQQAEEFTTRLAEQILQLSPRIVGCTSSLSQKVPSLALLRKIRELNPEVITLMGGADCETVMGRAVHQHFTWVDYVVSGEAEDLLVQLVTSIFENGRDVPLEALPAGVFAPLHRQVGYPENDKVMRAVASSYQQQVTPVYHDYFKLLKSLPTLSKIVHPCLPIQASRGCWHGRCKFCGLNAPQIPYRSRPADAVLAELDTLHGSYGIEHFEFLDNILDMRCFDDLIPELIRRGAPYKLFFEIRSNLPRKYFEMLRAAGVICCQPGIESLHTKALKAMRKGVTSWQNIQTLKWCRQYGIIPFWAILQQVPDDQDSWYEEMADLVPLLSHLPPPGGVISVQYQRNSHYFDRPHEYALNLTPIAIYDYIYPLEAAAMADISHTFEDEFYVSVKKDSHMAVLFHRPGQQRLQLSVMLWTLAYIGEDRPKLTMKDSNGEILIQDTRLGAVAPSFSLTGLQREIYLFCEQAMVEKQVSEVFQNGGYGVSEVKEAIEGLLEKKLMVRLDQRLLALAIEEPYMDFVPSNEKPIGWVDGQTDRKSLAGVPIEDLRNYVRKLVNKGVLDKRYVPQECR